MSMHHNHDHQEPEQSWLFSRTGVVTIGALAILGFLVYTGHYRSYYFVHYGSITPFDSLRYITNFFPLFAVLAGVGAGEAIGWTRRIGGRWRSHQE